MAKIYTPAMKSINPWNVDDLTGWTMLGAPATALDAELVPTVMDCVEEIAKGVSDLPFSVYNAKGDAVDDSDDYKNITGAIPDPSLFLWLTGASLVMTGQAYWGKIANTYGFTKGLTYWSAGNVTPNIEEKTTAETLTFRRNSRVLPAKDVLYFWLPDPKVEFGPPVNYPMLRAMKAAGSLSNIATFVDNYMSSGMVKAFIASSDTPPPNEDTRRETEDYLSRILLGVKNAMKRIRVLNNKNLNIQTVGGGIDELRNIGVIKEIKADVLEAFGVPQSRVFGNSANYATAVNDTIIFVTSEIIPIARIIQGALNSQVFGKYGYKLVFEPRRMEEFSVIIGEKVKAMQPLMDALNTVLTPAKSLATVIDILGLELSPEVMEIIQNADEEPEEPDEPKTPNEPDEPMSSNASMTSEDHPEPENYRALVELDKWRLKSEKAGKVVTWHSTVLPADICEAVKSGGMSWETAKDAILATPSDVRRLADAINRAVEG